ncbi:unnamed protein product [Soboliphyme baturini]|uniref:UBX domain-containing protein 4 n=1 Tax=Soboliphyme baturini TaxID=241478 RepID=A0A183IBY7_9BILA|nr:unnamed protein product [Soboliphyme baturini]
MFLFSTHTRIQFRLPDGSVLVENFPINDPLRSAHSFVAENFHALSSFILMKIFPRHEYTPEELDKSFSSLDLVPSAVLLVLPVRNFMFFKCCFLNVEAFKFHSRELCTFEDKSSYSGSTSSETQSRTFGRITDLRNDSDDAEGTWNGNSTQQL